LLRERVQELHKASKLKPKGKTRSTTHDFSEANWGRSTAGWLEGIKPKYDKIFPDACDQARVIAGGKPNQDISDIEISDVDGGRAGIDSDASDDDKNKDGATDSVAIMGHMVVEESALTIKLENVVGLVVAYSVLQVSQTKIKPRYDLRQSSAV
jgi:hypothetical protein